MPSKNTETVSITFPSKTLQILDSICDRKDFARSGFVNRAVKKYILLQQCNDSVIWDSVYHNEINKS